MIVSEQISLLGNRAAWRVDTQIGKITHIAPSLLRGLWLYVTAIGVTPIRNVGAIPAKQPGQRAQYNAS